MKMKTPPIPPESVQNAARELREAQVQYAEAIAHGTREDQERAVEEVDRARIRLMKADQEALAMRSIKW